MSLHHLSSSSWCPQAPWRSSGWSWTLLLAILPSTQRRGLVRLQIHEHPQSETRTMSNSHFDLPVQFTHTKDQQNLVSSASSLLFFVFISLFVSVFPGFILTVARGLYLARHISTLRYLKNMSFSWVELNSLIISNVFEGWKIYDFWNWWIGNDWKVD